jgi:hypothetical protein
MAAEGLAADAGRYGDGTAVAVAAELGALRTASTPTRPWTSTSATPGFVTLVDDNGWSYAKAGQWLLATAGDALPRP